MKICFQLRNALNLRLILSMATTTNIFGKPVGKIIFICRVLPKEIFRNVHPSLFVSLQQSRSLSIFMSYWRFCSIFVDALAWALNQGASIKGPASPEERVSITWDMICFESNNCSRVVFCFNHSIKCVSAGEQINESTRFKVVIVVFLLKPAVRELILSSVILPISARFRDLLLKERPLPTIFIRESYPLVL